METPSLHMPFPTVQAKIRLKRYASLGQASAQVWLRQSTVGVENLEEPYLLKRSLTDSFASQAGEGECGLALKLSWPSKNEAS